MKRPRHEWNALTSHLSSTELRVVEYLTKDWKKQYRITNIEQALRSLGIPFTGPTRLTIATCLKSLYGKGLPCTTKLDRWGPETFVLTNDEKLVARWLLLNAKTLQHFETLDEMGRALVLDCDTIANILEALQQLGFIDHLERSSRLGYRLSAGHKKFLSGLGLSFHMVTLSDGQKFNVECAIDALLLASNILADVSIDSSCFHCVERVHLRMVDGALVSQTPVGVRLYDGGG